MRTNRHSWEMCTRKHYNGHRIEVTESDQTHYGYEALTTGLGFVYESCLVVGHLSSP